MADARDLEAGEAFLPVARRSDATSERICSAVTLLPLQAAQRLLHCFGYSQSLRMQSGRTCVIPREPLSVAHGAS